MPASPVVVPFCLVIYPAVVRVSQHVGLAKVAQVPRPPLTTLGPCLQLCMAGCAQLMHHIMQRGCSAGQASPFYGRLSLAPLLHVPCSILPGDMRPPADEFHSADKMVPCILSGIEDAVFCGRCEPI